jgi:hypothetical protein
MPVVAVAAPSLQVSELSLDPITRMKNTLAAPRSSPSPRTWNRTPRRRAVTDGRRGSVDSERGRAREATTKGSKGTRSHGCANSERWRARWRLTPA